MPSTCFLKSPHIKTSEIVNEFIEFIKKVEKICQNASDIEFVNDIQETDKISERGLIEIKYTGENSQMGTLYMQDQSVLITVIYRKKVEFERTHVTRNILNRLDILIGFITGDKSRIPEDVYFDGENYFDGSWYFSAQDSVSGGVAGVYLTEVRNLSDKENKIAHYEINFEVKKR